MSQINKRARTQRAESGARGTVRPALHSTLPHHRPPLSSSLHPPARSHPPQRSHLKCERAAGAKANDETRSSVGDPVSARRFSSSETGAGDEENETPVCESGLRAVDTRKDPPTCFQVAFSRQSRVLAPHTMGCCSGRCTLIFICTLQLVSGAVLVCQWFVQVYARILLKFS